jgi:DNA-binding transcriptional LysR family regulator
MSQISWDYYRTFLSVMRDGSLSAAARDLGITQPTAGRHINALEESLNTTLFLRTAQGLTPTESALALLPYAETLADTSAALVRAASGSLGKVEGTVRISAADIIGIEILPPIIAQLQQAHPKLQIELSLSDTIEDLLKREADIAIRMVEPVQDALVTRYIGNFRLGMHASQSYLETYERPLEVQELFSHRLIGFDQKTPFIRSIIQTMRATTPSIPDTDAIPFAVRADSNLAQLALIKAGGGIGMCQIGLANRIGTLERLIPSMELPLPCWVAMHENLRSSPRCRAVFTAMVDGLKAYLKANDPDAPSIRRGSKD